MGSPEVCGRLFHFVKILEGSTKFGMEVGFYIGILL